MDWQTLLGWSGPVLDLAGLAALGAVLWQLRRDPTAAWREYEGKLRELQENLRLLVLQAEGEARELDRRLAAHADELRTLRGEGAAAASMPPTVTGEPAGGSPSATPAMSLAERVQQLAAARTPITEIARRLSLPVAEARVLAGLTTGGLAYGATPAGTRSTPGGGATRHVQGRGGTAS